MKKYALFVMNFPKDDQRRMRFLSEAPSLLNIQGNRKTLSEHTRKLHNGTYLIDLGQDLPFLGELMRHCTLGEYGQIASYDVLLFDTENDWTTYPIDNR